MQRLKELYGLADKSLGGIIKGYSKWLQSTLSGDLGFLSLYEAGRKLLGDFIWISFIVAFLSYILEIIIEIPMGIKAAVNQYSTTTTPYQSLP